MRKSLLLITPLSDGLHIIFIYLKSVYVMSRVFADRKIADARKLSAHKEEFLGKGGWLYKQGENVKSWYVYI